MSLTARQRCGLEDWGFSFRPSTGKRKGCPPETSRRVPTTKTPSRIRPGPESTEDGLGTPEGFVTGPVTTHYRFEGITESRVSGRGI